MNWVTAGLSWASWFKIRRSKKKSRGDVFGWRDHRDQCRQKNSLTGSAASVDIFECTRDIYPRFSRYAISPSYLMQNNLWPYVVLLKRPLVLDQEPYLLSPLDFLKRLLTSFLFKAAFCRLVLPRFFMSTSSSDTIKPYEHLSVVCQRWFSENMGRPPFPRSS